MSFSKFSPLEHIKRERARKASEQGQADKALAREQAAQLRAMLSAQRSILVDAAEKRIQVRDAARVEFGMAEAARQKAERLGRAHASKDGSIKIRLRKV